MDRFLWHGTENPTLRESIGAWLVALSYFAGGAMLLNLFARHRTEFPLAAGICGVVTILVWLLGLRIFRNGFPKPAN